MSNVIQMPGTVPATVFGTAHASNQGPHDKPRQDAFWETVTERCTNWHIARNVTGSYTRKCLVHVERLMAYAKKGFTELDESDYERWSAYLAKERDVASSTLRTYQKHVRQVASYVCATDDLQGLAVQTFGKKIKLFAHRYNSVAHVTDQGGARKKLRPMTHEEVDTFFDAMERRIEEAEAYAPRELRGLYRDKAMYHLMYVHGLRIAEIANIDGDDWRRVKEMPQLEKYGQLRVTGKGARTSGPRTRQVLTLDPSLALTMDWYERQVRPLYLPEGADEKAFFLSEQGRRISEKTIYARFKQHLELAGLQGRGFSPHTMRRNMIAHGGELTDMTVAQQQAGHATIGTTAIYGQVAPDHQRKKAAKMVATQIDALTEWRR